MSLAPAAVVAAPPLTPPTISLLNSVFTVEDVDPGTRWEAGITYQVEGCGLGNGSGQIFDPCNGNQTTGFSKAIAAASPALTGTPWGVVVSDHCSTFGGVPGEAQSHDYYARATRKLAAMESALIAKELMLNQLGLNVPIIRSADTDATPGGGAVSLKLALAYAEQAFMDAAPAVRPVIHVRPYILEAILGLVGGEGVIRREGNRYYTANDSLVIADAGYPGTGPGGQAVGSNSEWIYVTGPIAVRHSPISTLPTNIKDAVNRQDNSVTVYAERLAHASFDYNCAVIALNVQRTA